MARPRSKKKPERKAGEQPPLPTPRQPASSSPTRVLPMQLQVGDRLVDETGEWEVTVRPYTSPDGKNVHARVRRMDQPATADRPPTPWIDDGHLLARDVGRAAAEHAPGVRTVPRDRRVPQANRGACVPYAPSPRSPLRPFDGQSPATSYRTGHWRGLLLADFRAPGGGNPEPSHAGIGRAP